ncbi:MAG: tRNA 4-thiouridine(8) synthase ThiI, partial [Lachnospiraceae bacterium]|nr:tRNA 4-thiouridine(8) synthase ThiI [Lachnospiraceae bacterium]
FDKQDIIDIAEKIDTFETSILPYEDCCTTFVAKHPVTKPDVNVIRKSETKLEDVIEEMLERAYAGDEVIEIN